MAKLFCDNTIFFFSKLEFSPLHLIYLHYLFILYFKSKSEREPVKNKQTNKKTPFKQRPGSKELTWKISNMQRTDTNPSQTLPNH